MTINIHYVEYSSILEQLILSDTPLVVIDEIPSIKHTLELFSSQWFTTNVTNAQNIYAVHFKISEEIDPNFNGKPRGYEFGDKINFAIIYEFEGEKNESIIYWKSEGHDFHSLKINTDSDGILCDYCRNFLVTEIMNERAGILNIFKNKNDIELRDIRNENGANLIILAAQDNRDDVIPFLIKHGFDIDYEDSDDKNAIEYAWSNYINEESDEEKTYKSNRIMMMLLHENSKFPRPNFASNVHNASKEVSSFLRMCEDLHESIEFDNFSSVKEILDANPNLCFFYNRRNESLLAGALKNRKLKIYEYISSGISIGTHEDLPEIYEKIDSKKEARNYFRQYAKDLPEKHIFVLRSKCQIGYNDRQCHIRWKYVEDAFKVLNSYETCSKILKVAATWKKLKIYFDFLQDSVYYLDPTRSMNSIGVTYNSGIIYIGAKFLTDEKEKFLIYGTIIHELGHLAINITFMNNFDPFPIGNSGEKLRYEREVVKEAKKNQENEPIIKNVYDSYIEEHHHCELIVTVPQMLVMYHVEDPKTKCKNSKIIEERREKFGKLFRYVEDVVEPELEKALPILKQLNNQDVEIRFENLSKSMKAKITHGKIIFQDLKVSFFEIIGNDVKILSLLSGETIRMILLNTAPFKIGDVCKITAKHALTERHFIVNDIEIINRRLNVSEVIENIVKTKVFILSGIAGAGKTTTFEMLTIKLKEKYRTHWVSYIKLREQAQILEGLPHKLNVEIIVDALVRILKLGTDIEIQIFKKLFHDNKVILLVDGIDEISPMFNQTIIKILQILELTTGNQVWVSTRPQHAQKIQETLQVPITNLAQYTEEERQEFIKEILKSSDISEDQRDMIFEKVCDFVQKVESRGSEIYGIRNPLMIEIITELCIYKNIDLNLIHYYGIYQMIIERQREKIDEKVHIRDRDPFTDFSLKKVHHVYAISLILGHIKELKLQDLTIMKKWEKERVNWTTDQIQRYGFLLVDIKDFEISNINANFVHRTYAEFFVAEFLLTTIFDVDSGINDEECPVICEIIKLITNDISSYQAIHSFILSHLKNRTETTPYKLHPKFCELLKLLVPNVKSFEMICYMFRKESDEFKNSWIVKNHVLVKNFFLETRKFHDLDTILVAIDECFEPNWYKFIHDLLSIYLKMITFKSLEEIEDLVKISGEFRKFNVRLYKFLELISKAYWESEKGKVVENYFTKIMLLNAHYIDSNVLKMLFETFFKCRKTIAAFSVEFLKEICEFKTPSDRENFVFLSNNMERQFFFKKKHLRLILLTKYPLKRHPLIASIESKDMQLFQVYKTLCEKYLDSWSEIKDIVLEYKSHAGEDLAPEINEFIEKVSKTSEGETIEVNTPTLVTHIQRQREAAANFFLTKLAKTEVSRK